MMNLGFYWIGIDAGGEYGALEILASDRRGRLALTPVPPVTERDF